MNPLLSKLHRLMHEYSPVEFNTKFNENLEFLTDNEQKNNVEEPVKNIENFQELDQLFEELNSDIIDKGFMDAQVYAYVYDNLCAFVATLSDLKESNIEDFLKSIYAQE